MSSIISEDLKASGVASVICVLKDAERKPPARSAVKGIRSFFVSSEMSQTGALALAAADAGAATQAAPKLVHYENLGVAYGTVTREGLKALRADDQVAAVKGAPQLSLIRPTRAAAARLTRNVTWGIEALRIPELWKEGLTGRGVLIGHLDTGIDGKHPALRAAIEDFEQFDDFARPVTPKPKPFDSGDHGTHTAATIAGRKVGGRSVGVAPGAKLASAMVIEGGDAVGRVLGGMDWAVGKGVRVLSMSLGFRGFFDDFVPIVQILRSRNVLPVFAVGNEGPGTSRSPGNYAEPVSVGASDQGGLVADFSSSQRFKRRGDPLVPDLVGPGTGIISAKPGGGFQEMDGTSMATPHLAGLAALLTEAKPDAPPEAIERAIYSSCTLGPGMSPTRANRGFPDGVKALAAL